jgi:hypothetical protein
MRPCYKPSSNPKPSSRPTYKPSSKPRTQPADSALSWPRQPGVRGRQPGRPWTPPAGASSLRRGSTYNPARTQNTWGANPPIQRVYTTVVHWLDAICVASISCTDILFFNFMNTHKMSCSVSWCFLKTLPDSIRYFNKNCRTLWQSTAGNRD